MDGLIKIESGIPIPRIERKIKHRGIGVDVQDELSSMKVGDSFFVPLSVFRSINRHLYDNSSTVVFTSRTLIEDNVYGRRVWRVK